MSTQIDPLTDLPMVFDSIVQQIPLGVQTTPWADLEATARPTTPELYPDNHFTVGAFLSAQNQDDKSAQTVMTDGDHNLRVKVTNAASGGGTIYEDVFDLTQNDNRESGFGTDTLWTLDPVDYAGVSFASLSASVMVDPNSFPPSSGKTSFHFYYGFAGPTMWLLHGYIEYGIPSTGYGVTSWSGVFSPPVPIRLDNSTLSTNTPCAFVYTSEGTIDLLVSSTFKLIRAHP